MKQVTHSLLVAGLSALLGSATLSAQSLSEEADIPFNFHAQQRTLPAGKYVVDQPRTGGLFLIHDRAGHSLFVTAPLMKKANPNHPNLKFARYGDQYVLSEIAMPDSDVGYAVRQSTIEKNLTRKLGVASFVTVALKSH
jgi:hypothetical protein